MNHNIDNLLEYPGVDLACLVSNINDANCWINLKLNLEDIEGSLRSELLKPNLDIRNLMVKDELKASAVVEISKKRKALKGTGTLKMH